MSSSVGEQCVTWHCCRVFVRQLFVVFFFCVNFALEILIDFLGFQFFWHMFRWNGKCFFVFGLKRDAVTHDVNKVRQFYRNVHTLDPLEISCNTNVYWTSGTFSTDHKNKFKKPKSRQPNMITVQTSVALNRILNWMTFWCDAYVSSKLQLSHVLAKKVKFIDLFSSIRTVYIFKFS